MNSQKPCLGQWRKRLGLKRLRLSYFIIIGASLGFAAGAASAAYTTSLAMLVAGFTNRRAYAAVFLVGLFIVSTPFTAGLSTEIGGTAGQWISMFNLSNIPVHVNDLIFGEVSNITSVAPAGEFPAWMLVSWYLLWVLVPGGVLWARYRRLSP